MMNELLQVCCQTPSGFIDSQDPPPSVEKPAGPKFSASFTQKYDYQMIIWTIYQLDKPSYLLWIVHHRCPIQLYKVDSE